MGADLYIPRVFNPNRRLHEPAFDHWVARRDALQKAGQTGQAARAQRQVEHLYGKMYSRGYFRDGYNVANLLWLFGLSWWRDVAGVLTNRRGEMSPSQAAKLLRMLHDR